MAQQEGGTKFGTFGGVFTPCTLTILGVIMFLRFGHVVGQAGVLHALLIVLIAKVITTLTSLSLSAIATNTRVKGGGAYYLISRSLGVEFGGAIGVVFFLAQAISVALYVIGFTEALMATVPGLAGHFTLSASLLNLAVFVLVLTGASWAIKVQYVILALLGLAIASFYVGAGQSFSVETLEANLQPHYLPGASFFTMFALFFPAVTGIMAGANMSGDLKNPARSIPRGTLAAVAFTGLIYASQAVLLGCSGASDELIGDNLVIKQLSRWPLLITAGVFAATLSSAVGSMLGAPRILQAFGRDEVFKRLRFFAAGSGASNEPRRAIVLTFLIAQGCILLGDLDAIAPVITMAFMITYGTLNLATFYEAVIGNPSYRPTFRFCHWTLSLAGALGCLAVMFLIDWQWAAVSILLMLALHWYIGFREIEARWGDLQSGLTFERARKSLLRLEQQLSHPKNWRPTILALAGTVWTRPHLPVYGHWLTSGHGILTLGQVIQGELVELNERRTSQDRILHQFIRDQELEAFGVVVVARSLSDGIEALVQCQGLGGLRPNTVLLGWPNDPERAESFGGHLRLIVGLGRSVVAVRLRGPAATDRDDVDAREVPAGTIDVWWRGQKNGKLLLLLAHMLHRNTEWRQNPIRLLRIAPNEAARDECLGHLAGLVTESRITAEPVVLVSDDVPGTIQHASRHAALALMGLEAPGEGAETAFFGTMERLAGDLPRVLFVNNAGGMELEG